MLKIRDKEEQGKVSLEVSKNWEIMLMEISNDINMKNSREQILIKLVFNIEDISRRII